MLLSGCSQNTLKSLQLTQNAAARLLTGTWKRKHISHIGFSSLLNPESNLKSSSHTRSWIIIIDYFEEKYKDTIDCSKLLTVIITEQWQPEQYMTSNIGCCSQNGTYLVKTARQSSKQWLTFCWHQNSYILNTLYAQSSRLLAHISLHFFCLCLIPPASYCPQFASLSVTWSP